MATATALLLLTGPPHKFLEADGAEVTFSRHSIVDGPVWKVMDDVLVDGMRAQVCWVHTPLPSHIM